MGMVLVKLSGNSLDSYTYITENEDDKVLISIVENEGYIFDYECESGYWFIRGKDNAVILNHWCYEEIKSR